MDKKARSLALIAQQRAEREARLAAKKAKKKGKGGASAEPDSSEAA